MCAVRVVKGCRRADFLIYIREDDMIFFVIGFLLIIIFPRLIPAELWIGLSLVEGFIEFVVAVVFALTS